MSDRNINNSLIPLAVIAATFLSADMPGSIPLYAMPDREEGTGMGSHHSTQQSERTILPPFQAAVSTFSLQGGTVAGETVTFNFNISTTGAGKRSVPYIIYYRDRLNGTTRMITAGERRDVIAGTSFSGKELWNSAPGIYDFFMYVDPSQTLGESAEQQKDNRSETVTRIFANWAGWLPAAQTEISSCLKLWIEKARFGVNLKTDDALVLNSGSMNKMLPPNVVSGALKVVNDAWMQWAHSISLPATQTELPFPLASLPQNTASLKPAHIEAALRQRLGPVAEWPGGTAATGEIARWLSRSFEDWKNGAVVVPAKDGGYRLEGVWVGK